jgi:hypothetical protein
MKVKITYIGRRIFNADSIADAFLFDKKEIFYDYRNRYLTIGDVYQVNKEKSGVKLPRRPERIGANEDVTNGTLSEWRLKDQAAEEFKRRNRASAKSKKFGDIWFMSLKTIHEDAEKLSWQEKEMLAKRIINVILYGGKE